MDSSPLVSPFWSGVAIERPRRAESGGKWEGAQSFSEGCKLSFLPS